MTTIPLMIALMLLLLLQPIQIIDALTDTSSDSWTLGWLKWFQMERKSKLYDGKYLRFVRTQFCAIYYPEKSRFFDAVRGPTWMEMMAFMDRHKFTERDNATDIDTNMSVPSGLEVSGTMISHLPKNEILFRHFGDIELYVNHTRIVESFVTGALVKKRNENSQDFIKARQTAFVIAVVMPWKSILDDPQRW